MRIKAIHIIIILFTTVFFVSCSGPKKNKISLEDSMALTFVSMDKRWPDRILPFVDAKIDGQKEKLLLDTGALGSIVVGDHYSGKYKNIGNSQATSASGKVKKCHRITPELIAFGKQKFSNHKIRWCKSRELNILALDLLSEKVFQIDLKHKRLNILNSLPKNSNLYPVRKMKKGHITVPMVLGDDNVYALFDTGADITFIDLAYVEKYPQIFKFIRDEENEDGNGVMDPSKLYVASSIKIGNLELKNVHVSAMKFHEGFKRDVEGAPIVLGNNVIDKAVWNFDYKLRKWSMEPY